MADNSRHDNGEEESPPSSMALEATDILPPTTMVDGKYRLGRLIGEGGMGAVYEAEHTGLGIKVAVKLLNEVFTADPKALGRFRREARAAAAIRHPNVVEVTDTGTDEEGTPFIIMELLEGESLSSLLRREKVISPQMAVSITSQILAGLAAAHAKGVIHRDLKPGNIILARKDDGTCQVKILDFGISKFYSGEALPQDVTAAGAVIGTPRFMAPEQAIGQPDLDARVDIYATGVLLYRMVTGRLPFTSSTNDGIIRQILESKPRPPRQIRPEIPEELETVILQAMEANRERRLQDARSFFVALQQAMPELLGGTLQITMPTGTTGGTTPPDLGSQSSIGLPSLPPISVTGQRLSSVTARPPAPEGDLPPTGVRVRPRRWWLPVLAAAILLAGGGIVAWLVRGSSKPSAERMLGAGSGPDAGMRKLISGNPPLRFGITRFLPTDQLVREHRRLIDYLSRQLGRPVELKIHEDYVDLSAQLAGSKLELAALSSYGYVRAKRRWPDLELVATHVTSGANSYEGFVVARAGEGVSSLEDLKDRVFCYVGPTSSSGYLYPRALFRRRGMDPDRYFKASRFTGDHLSALKALQSGACDGAAVFAGIFFEAKKYNLTPEKFTVLATTDRIPYDAYCIPPGLPPSLSADIRRALLSLKPESESTRRVLGQGSRITGFIAGKDTDYDPVRRIERYLDGPNRLKRPDP